MLLWLFCSFAYDITGFSEEHSFYFDLTWINGVQLMKMKFVSFLKEKNSLAFELKVWFHFDFIPVMGMDTK